MNKAKRNPDRKELTKNESEYLHRSTKRMKDGITKDTLIVDG